MADFATDALAKFRYRYVLFVAEQLTVLLETKHLYQKISLVPVQLPAELRTTLYKGEEELFDQLVNGLVKEFASYKLALTEKMIVTQRDVLPSIIVGNVKIYCGPCHA